MANEVNKNDQSGPASRIDSLASMAEKLDKIWTFVAKVLTFVVVGLVAGYSWIAKQVVVMPREWIALTMAILAAIGIGSYVLAYVRRSRLGRLGSVGMAAVGTFAVGLAATVWLLLPPKPAWRRIDVPQLLLQQTPQDLALVLMLDQLAGRNGLIPGGETYKTLIHARRAGEKVQEEWAGYYAPLVVANTMPSEISLNNVGAVNAANASIGVVVVVWMQGDDGPKIEPLKEEGFKALQSSISVPDKLRPAERAAVLVFVYPLTAAASASLPDDIHQVVTVR